MVSGGRSGFEEEMDVGLAVFFGDAFEFVVAGLAFDSQKHLYIRRGLLF